MRKIVAKEIYHLADDDMGNDYVREQARMQTIKNWQTDLY